MATLAALAAAATVAGAGASIYSTMSRDTSGPQRQADYGAAQLQDARNNEMYQRMVSAMVNQRSIAGSQDSWGSSVQYDPGSNTWRSQLGAEPEAADRASMQASIRQNTTQARMAELANEQAALRAARAGPAADAAQRQLADYRPMGRDDLVALLTRQGTTAANAAYTPIVQDTLRQYARTGVNAGPVLSDLGRTQADSLRKTLMDAQIAGMTGVDQVNESRRRGLADTATTAAAFASPAFQSSTVAPSANSKALADTLAQRAAGSAQYPAYGASGVGTAGKGVADAYGALSKAAGTVPYNPGADVGKELATLMQDKNLQNTVGSWFGGGSGSGTGSVNMNSTYTNPAEQNYYDTYRSGKQYTF